MRTQTENGILIGADAGILLTPEALVGAARRYARSVQLNDGRDLTVVSDPRLDIGVTDPATGNVIAGDTGGWYLFSKTNRAIDVASYTRTPQVDVWVVDGQDGKWGFGYSVAWIIAVAPVDFRGARRHLAP